MPKRKPKVPSCRLHRPSGQGVVTLSGRDFYLGPYDAPESRDRYNELVGRWLGSGRRLPHPEAEPLTVNELILRYYRFCEGFYGSRPTAVKRLSQIKVAQVAQFAKNRSDF